MTSPKASKTQAIETALVGDWIKAVEINQQLLKEDPNDVETLNRLAFAQVIIGKVRQAKLNYQKVLDLDSQNPIALKNLKKLKGLGANEYTGASHLTANRDSLFLEETGKTKVVDLINIADAKVTSHLLTGELLTLTVKRLKIFVLDPKGKFIGMLPDDIGKRLIKFINGGNGYEAYIKTIDRNRVTIFIKEVKRSNRFKNQPSFIFGEKTKVSLSPKNYKSDLEEEPEEESE